jgi:hypothetical protein
VKSTRQSDHHEPVYLQKMKKPHGNSMRLLLRVKLYLDAAGAEAAGAAGAEDSAGAAAGAAGAEAAGADAAGAEPWSDEDGRPWPASPCMSTLSPPFMMTNSAIRAKAMKPTKIFHMIEVSEF